MSFLGNYQLYVGISVVLLGPLLLVAKKKWNKRQHGQGYCEQVILFSRYPVPGVTKTRLIGELGEQGAARAQHIMTDHLLNQLSEFQQQRSSSWIELKYHGGTPAQMDYWLGWRRSSARLKCSWSRQDNGHLGQKMAAAFQKAFDRGAQRVVIIGSDIPAINKDILNQAMDSLKNDESNSGGSDMVLGPAKDGGYYLVALNTKALNHIGNLFEGIDWGTNQVFKQQMQVAKSLGVKVDVLPWMLQDVDYPEDLSEFEKTGVTVKQLKEPVLSVVIPVLNEGSSIQDTLSNVVKNCTYLKYTEIIVIDGGSLDDTVEKVEQFVKANSGKYYIRLVRGTKGRGIQLNLGAKEATGDNLLFLHADTRLPRGFDRHILLTLGVPGVSAGAFKFGCDVLHGDCDSVSSDFSWLSKMKMTIIEYGTNIRAKYLELPYGDQAIFMRRSYFDGVGGFPDFPLMEDYALVKLLQKEGHVAIVEDEYAITSARRWQQRGIIRNTAFNSIVIILYNLGVHPNTLAKLYYGSKR